MAAFRLLNQFPVYFDAQGRLADGGRLDFFDSGTTTPKDVFGNQALTVNNGSTVAIASDGRTAVDVWGDGSYRVRLYDADATLLGEADDVEVAGGTGATIPALVTGQFLTNNGALMLWAPIREMPDPTGQDGKYPVASGSGYALQAPPAAPVIPDPDVVVGTGTFRAGIYGESTKYYVQTGTGSAPATGVSSTQVSVTFPTPFASVWSVVASITNDTHNTVGFIASSAVLSKSVSGFTFKAGVSAHQGGSGSDANLIGPVNFDWVAFGTIVIVDAPVAP